MMVLLVEDDEGKRRQLLAYLGVRLPQARIVEATTFRAAIDRLKEKAPDLVLLDITIPSRPRSSSGRDNTLVFGGRDVLRQMRRLRVSAPVIVVTAYERFDKGPESMSLADLEQQLSDVYPEFYRGAVSFSFRYETWRADLDRLLVGAGVVISEDGPSEERRR